jgi:preprotein translocase subunit SecD
MQANFRIFGLQIESMPDNDWNEVIIDFKNKLNLAKERIETERKLEEKRIEDQKRLEAIKKAETEEEERKKQAELAPDKEKIENYLVELLQVKQPKVETEGAKQIITNINKLLLKN